MVGDYRGSFNHPISDDSDHSGDASSLEEDTSSSLYSVGKECIGTEWTDEKHSLYLKSMEASFVDQLYNSLNLNPNKSRKFGSKPCDEQKMNVKQPDEYLRSPWIKHYKPLPKTPQNAVRNKSEMFICSLLREGSSHLRHRDQEVSDQNFGNEVTQGENGSSKKMKTVTNTDQVVPIRKTPET